MIFWLKKPEENIEYDAFIYLEQLLKASGLIKDYNEGRNVLHAGKVKVNDVVTFSRRKMIREGDIVVFKDETINIYGKKKAIERAKENQNPKQKIKSERLEIIKHKKQRVNKWIEKDIKK